VAKTPDSKVWVFAEHREGKLAEAALELLGKSFELTELTGQKVALVVIGHQLNRFCKELLSFGADEILVAEHPLLKSYCSQTYVKVLENAIRKHQPEIFLLGATAMGTDLGARLAARLRTGLAARCTDLRISPEKKLLAVVPGWGGNVLATVHSPFTNPQMATVTPGVFDIPKGRPKGRDVTGRIIPFEVELKPRDVTYQILEIRKEEAQELALERAEVVIAGGWGIGSKEDWQWIENLASALNGVVGATRPPVDEGWAKEKQMIGQSGRTIHPKLYIGIGISGEMHHMVGIKGVEMIVAINRDPNALIFEWCDLGLVGDFREIIPSLIKAIQNYKEGTR
jgi:electron transfer flavoprotein alpha subunit